MISPGPRLTPDDKDNRGRTWRAVLNPETQLIEYLPHTGVFEIAYDTKGRFEILKFKDGVEVDLSDAEREEYLARKRTR